MYTTVHLSLLADLTLGAILIFLWVVRPVDRHAMYWGIGQILLGIAGAIWSTKTQAFWGPLLVVASGTLGLMTYMAGTQHFCGLPIKWRHHLLAWSLYALLQTGIATLSHAITYTLSLGVMGCVFVWCAWRLSQRKHAYRAIAVVFLLRACTIFALGTDLFEGKNLEQMFFLGFILKAATALGLIHAVLHENEQRFRALLNGLGHGFLIRDAEGIIRFASQKLADLLGVKQGQDLVGKNIAELSPSRSPDRSTEWFAEVTAPGAQLPRIDEIQHRRKDGSDIPIEIISVPYEDRGQIQVLSQIIDIQARKAQEAALQRAAMLDEPTDLFNRRTLRQLLGGLLEDSIGSGHSTALLLIDLDHFRRINETLGHTVGDELLRLVATRLKDQQGSHEVLARFGGDEFVLVVPELPLASAQEEAKERARRILQTLAAPFPLDPFRIALKASIGIAVGPADGLDAESLLSAADTALYNAKDAGRSRFCLFEEQMSLSSRSALLIDEALQHAIARNEFRLVYQPIVEAHSRRLRKVEALLRWTTPTLGFVAPDRFIPIAEETGQIVEIGNWVIQEAARQAAQWAAQNEHPIRIAVNVSAAQLVAPDFLRIIDEAIRCGSATPGELEIEMTERVLIDEADTVVQVLEAVHARGLSSSLDDFGTGYSSLSYLTRFHLRTLKIDRAFVNGIEHDERSLALVRAIIAMGHSLGMEIVAEGVETEAQAQILTDLGCEYLQGYLISRPVPPDELPGLRPRQQP